MSEKAPNLGAVIVAGGNSSRMQGVDKQISNLAGVPVALHSVSVFNSMPEVGWIVFVTSGRNLEFFRNEISAGDFNKVVAVVESGERRQDSVKNGLDAISDYGGDALEFVAIHDGARPFIDVELVQRGVRAAEKVGAGIAAVPVKDTIKTAPHRVVTSTPDRSELWSVQTPQVFRRDVIKAAHDIVTDDVTDDASMVESIGGLVAVFDGSNDNIKITTPEDLQLANLIFQRRSGVTSSGSSDTSGARFGVGFDGHKLVPGGPLQLGGTEIEFDHHLDGHSDGDVLLHAIASSILGAAGLGDLGGNFPSSDPRYKDIPSQTFIAESTRLAKEAGWMVVHVDATIIAQRPRLASHTDEMSVAISQIDGLQNSELNIKVTSTDHVGAIGAGDGIAAQAVATLNRI
jgi:2-C-methyl-D-erythritol 4-phosphate cytidylyltransferase/2-C-methyl-D-erythritol 2,4-cyclodiphosphate synthase